MKLVRELDGSWTERWIGWCERSTERILVHHGDWQRSMRRCSPPATSLLLRKWAFDEQSSHPAPKVMQASELAATVMHRPCSAAMLRCCNAANGGL